MGIAMNDTVTKNKSIFQILWGVALVLAGIGIFYRIPEVMLKVEKIEQFTASLFIVRFCFYILGILLIGSGIKKIYKSFQKHNADRTTNSL